MNNIRREITDLLYAKIKPGKVLIISGARRTGKTFMIKELIKNINEPTILLNGEDMNIHSILSKRSAENYRQLTGSRNLLIIDEAQKIPDIGSILKLMTDELPHLKIVVTGSSSFEMNNMTGEPLTGRKNTLTLFPLSEREFLQTETPLERPDRLKQRLVYGNYPELLHIRDAEDKRDYLTELVNSYLLRDILDMENIRHSSRIFNLLRLIAFQTGSMVSLNELGSQLSISKNTVDKYLDLLSKVHILFKLEGYSRNLRKEITKNSKWYFFDNGIRNAIVADFKGIELRNDTGQLWENYIISERIKYQQIRRKKANNYFWRNYDQQEIDWVEERDGVLSGFEFKWTESKFKMPTGWRKAYPDAGFMVVNSDNYMEWIS